MDNQPATNPSRNALIRLWPWLLVLFVILFTGFIRVRLLEMPLERDEGEYAYAGQLILQGIPPYELAYNMKLPGTYYAYAIGMAIFGQTIAGVHLTLLAANALTIIFVFLLARKLFGVTAGLVACASYGVMSASPTVAGLAAHATHFVVLFAVPATLLLCRAVESKERRTFFFSGLLYGLAFLMKQQGICFGVFGSMVLLWQAIRSKSIFTRDFAATGLTFGLGIILPFAFFCLSSVIAGDFDRFWFWTFTYAGSYATTIPLSEGVGYLGNHLRQTFDMSLGFWILATMGVLLASGSRKSRNQMVFIVCFWLCSFLGAAVGFYFRPHYFILVLPAFAIMTGMGVVLLQQALRFKFFENVFKSLPLILFATVLSWVVFYQSQAFFQMPALRLCKSLYQLNPFVEACAAAQYIREHSAKDARIAVIGSEPEIYFYAQRHSATGYIYTYALMEPQPAAPAMQREMIQEIETNKPEYIVYVTYGLSWLTKPYSDHTILDWFSQYSIGLYDKVGVVGERSGGEPVSVWDDAAKNYQVPAGQYLVILKRKADADTDPPKKN